MLVFNRLCVFIGLLPLAFAPVAGRPAPAAPVTLVFSNGCVQCPTNALTAGWGREPFLRLDFGLPAVPPTDRIQEAGLPLLETQWETGGVRYTQKVLLSHRGAAFPPAPNDTVWLIQITGQNQATEYTNAAASLAVLADGRPLHLELRGGLVHARVNGAERLLGVLDVPSEGVAATNGARLRFQGSMPPGTSGSLTLKLPARPLAGETEINQLRDLEFDEEVQRMRQAWSRLKPAPPPPVAWGERR